MGEVDDLVSSGVGVQGEDGLGGVETRVGEVVVAARSDVTRLLRSQTPAVRLPQLSLVDAGGGGGGGQVSGVTD